MPALGGKADIRTRLDEIAEKTSAMAGFNEAIGC
jgi:hypothetical protein